MSAEYKLELLGPAQRELEEIAQSHFELVGPISARNITDRIYAALENLKIHPYIGFACRNRQLAIAGYRTLICGNYLCFYRLLGKTVLVCHIVDGRTDYPKHLTDLPS
ncbi:MAG: type II toxin-antitoxin system RelE/ParE family toxin [Oscillospiraceae bacterium]|nr:type II toxin-antitoxin system RelE/ParE family toxin [Oscillospiraceae bacterium]